MMRLLAAAAMVATGLAACATEELEPTYGDGLGTAENPIPQDDVSYLVRSQIAPTGTTLPAHVTTVAASMRSFAQNPAQTLLSLADTADVAELATLQSMPSALWSRLPGWIDGELDKAIVATRTVRQVAADVTGFADTALTRFGLDSTLSFTPSKTTHTLTALTFRLNGLDVVIPLGGLKADTIGQQPEVTIGEGGTITFGDHEFGLAFGDHAWHAMNLASSTVFGADVRTTLTSAVNCRALSQAVAAKCYNGSCVGRQPQLQAVCERSLDTMLMELSTRTTTFDLDVLRYVSGSARLVDDNGDGLANRIEDGIWDSEMPAGRARATFTALADGR